MALSWVAIKIQYEKSQADIAMYGNHENTAGCAASLSCIALKFVVFHHKAQHCYEDYDNNTDLPHYHYNALCYYNLVCVRRSTLLCTHYNLAISNQYKLPYYHQNTTWLSRPTIRHSHDIADVHNILSVPIVSTF